MVFHDSILQSRLGPAQRKLMGSAQLFYQWVSSLICYHLLMSRETHLPQP